MLKRPLGGWGARRWRAEVGAWLFAAYMWVMAWASGMTILGLINEVAGLTGL